MGHPLLVPDLRELILERDDAGLRDFFNEHHPATAAELLEDLQPEEVQHILQLLDSRPRAELFTYLPAPLQDALVAFMARDVLAALLTDMRHDERADLAGRLSPEQSEQVMPLLAKAEREDIRRLASYRDGTAGAVMTTDYAALPPDVTAGEAIDRLRHVAPDRETIYYCYVLSQDRKLLGLVSLKDLILSPPGRRVSAIMQSNVVSASVNDDQEQAAATLMEYDLLALPIVDADGHLVGIVTHDDVADVMVEETTEDVHRMAAVGAMSENYLDMPFATVWRKRVVWLSCLFVAELLTFTVLVHFENEIDTIVALSLFMPLCISTGGNSGGQAATLITRSIALGHVSLGDWKRVLWHELFMGAALGLTLGTIGFARAALTPESVLKGADRWQLALVIGQAVAAICLWGTVVGSILPVIFKRLGFDPAFASSPFVATFVDVTGILFYFSIARMYLM